MPSLPDIVADYVYKITNSCCFSRLLAISSTGDSAAQYINYMNSFFTAQKLNIPVDCCMLGQDSGLLQQGCDITGGVYLKVDLYIDRFIAGDLKG